MEDQIKSMQLYPRAERIFAELEAAGFSGDAALPLDVLTRFDQLHYHGTEALDAAIAACDMGEGQAVLEVGSGWGGCARYLAHTSGASLMAVELQRDYHDTAQTLTRRAGLGDRVQHVNADFLDVPLGEASFDHVVSWLALFHIPDRPRYIAKIFEALRPGGVLFAEDLFLIEPPEDEEDFARHLFPNSLVPIATYEASLSSAGFQDLQLRDMTADWTEFTATRLIAFEGSRAEYEAKHGPDGYTALHTFYAKMSGYFAAGHVGGIRVIARKPG